MSIRETEPIVGRRLATLTLLLGGLTAFGPLSMDLYLPAFQPGDLVAQRRLRHPATSGGPREIQLLGHGDEVLELAQIHLFPRLIAAESCLGQIDGTARHWYP